MTGRIVRQLLERARARWRFARRWLGPAVRRWLGSVRAGAIFASQRVPVGLASCLTGFATFIGIVAGTDEIGPGTVVQSLVAGLLAGIALWLVERQLPGHRVQRGALAGAPTEPAPPEPPMPTPHVVPARTATTFRGRRNELVELRRRHDEQRAARAAGSADAGAAVAGAVILTIHGMPGVGKSALARQLQRLLEPMYPNGTIHANLGVAGQRRAPTEILKSFLAQLDRPVADPTVTASQLVHLFRSVTADKQLLFVFDAARDHEQVRALLPTGPECAVIVTSRRDLSSALNRSPSLLLKPPDLDDALDILSAHAGVAVESDPDAAIELVDYCGRLPLAIVAAAERIAVHGTDVRHVCDTLRRADTRLELLEHSGRSVRERFISEMNRLTPRQRKALCLLTVVPSPTFLSRVLAPMLRVPENEAEDVMATLAEAQLVAAAGMDEAIGMPRFRLNPIVRLVCREELSALPPDEVRRARTDLRRGYIRIVADVTQRIDEDPDYNADERTPPASWSASGHSARYASKIDYAVRLEYPNLLQTIEEAWTRGNWGLCWRIAARLGGRVPDVRGPTLRVYDLALRAAKSDGSAVGEMTVLLAKASYLIAIECYGHAFACIEAANTLVDRVLASGPDPDTARSAVEARVRMHWLLAEAYVQMAAFDRARTYVELTASLAAEHGIDTDTAHLALLRADIHRVTISMPVDARAGVVRGDDPLAYHVALVESEAARRRRDWPTAEAYLNQAMALSDSDARRTANVTYRVARLALDQCGPTDRDATPADAENLALVRPPAQRATRCAAAAVVAFRRMGNQVGVIRAQCLLIRTHAASGNIAEAELLLHMVTAQLRFVRQLAGDAFLPLKARLAHALGDVHAARGDDEQAWTAYMAAATLYTSAHDWSGRRAVMVCLARQGLGPRRRAGDSPMYVEEYLGRLDRRGAAFSPTPRHPFSADAVER